MEFASIQSFLVRDTSRPSTRHTPLVTPSTDTPPEPSEMTGSAARSIVLGIAPVLLRDCLHRLIEEAEFEVLASSDDGTHVVEAALTKQPDVVMTTVTLPPFGGLDVITSIAHTRADIPVIAVIDTASPHDAERALRAGATTCLYLDDSFERCHHVLQQIVLGNIVMTRGLEHRDVRGTMTPGSPLSRREEQVLNLVVQGRSIAQIASDLVISRKTVKHHLSATYSKLGVHSRTDAVVTAIRHGLVRVRES